MSSSNENKMVDVVETFTSYSQGFQLLWTIPDIQSLIDSWDKRFHLNTWSRESPVFEAFSKRRWMLQAQFLHPRNVGMKRFAITLYQLDEKGKRKSEQQIKDDHPFFNGTQLRMAVSFLNKNGELFPPYVSTEKGPFRAHMFLTGLTLDKVEFEYIVHEGPEKAAPFIQVQFEFRILYAPNNREHLAAAASTKEFPTIDRAGLYDSGKFTDFVIRTGDGKEIRAHRAILNASASPYFKAMFKLGGMEVQRGELTVPEQFPLMNALIRFLYTGRLPSGINRENWSVSEMYIAADKYQVKALKDFLGDAFDSFLSVENASGELVRANLGGIDSLKQKAAEFIRAHRNAVFETEGWRELCRDHHTLVAFLFAAAANGQ